jgi:hypothetical protein
MSNGFLSDDIYRRFHDDVIETLKELDAYKLSKKSQLELNRYNKLHRNHPIEGTNFLYRLWYVLSNLRRESNFIYWLGIISFLTAFFIKFIRGITGRQAIIIVLLLLVQVGVTCWFAYKSFKKQEAVELAFSREKTLKEKVKPYVERASKFRLPISENLVLKTCKKIEETELLSSTGDKLKSLEIFFYLFAFIYLLFAFMISGSTCLDFLPQLISILSNGKLVLPENYNKLAFLGLICPLLVITFRSATASGLEKQRKLHERSIDELDLRLEINQSLTEDEP